MFALKSKFSIYPQKTDWGDVLFWDKAWIQGEILFRRFFVVAAWRQKRFVKKVLEYQQTLPPVQELSPLILAVKKQLRVEGLSENALVKAFALVRCLSQEILGMAHYPNQIRGGYILVRGLFLEMDTGEGKTLTASLPAIVFALSGQPVQVVTVNDYLAERDLALMEPLYRRFGLTSSVVAEESSPEERRNAYRADIVYCTGKTLIFDYLKDRIVIKSRIHQLHGLLDKYTGRQQQSVFLSGLRCAVIDEVDSVLVDEARTPLIISKEDPTTQAEASYRQAYQLSLSLNEATDFVLHLEKKYCELTQKGRDRLRELSEDLPGLFQYGRYREEQVLRALAARFCFQRDVDYIVRDDKVMIVDENTGRIMADRSWEKGLHQFVEIKEDISLTPDKHSISKISSQLFFQRFLTLSGMSGTCQEVASEFHSVYKTGMVRVPPRKKSLRKKLPSLILPTDELRWQAVVQSVRACYQRRQPVLVGTRSVKASEAISLALEDASIPHVVLNAKQDGQEAEIIAEAGKDGQVTIATNMAGRGTDIKLTAQAKKNGGLHVVVTDLHDSKRVDRQLIGRCARQGEPGTWQEILSMEGSVLLHSPRPITLFLKLWLKRSPQGIAIRRICRVYLGIAQKRIEQQHKKTRKQMLKADFALRQSLSFSGKME